VYANAPLAEKKLAGERPPKPPPVTSQPACHEVSGYMPLRQEFDVEYDNDAEIIVSQLAFTDEDTPEDKGKNPSTLPGKKKKRLFSTTM